ncbi:unnamed protein product [Linum tenue]|uniref:Uncharacterized protein n=1 Tax=Linum tenue TaxID=586396 RepID=A0AAV0LB83_9ROSI|nr:unnamed protein product [Linum tenue]
MPSLGVRKKPHMNQSRPACPLTLNFILSPSQRFSLSS